MTSEPSFSLESLLSARPEDLESLLGSLTPAEADELLAMLPLWRPQPGPQTLAYESQADILGYGGAASGGKTDLLIGLAATQHQRSALFRRVGENLPGIVERCRKVYSLGGGQVTDDQARFPDGRIVEFESMQLERHKESHQGRARDFFGFDEATQFTRSQIEFVIAWNRSPDPSQRCRVVLAFNPPETAEGEWIIDFFGPWLDPQHPNPAKPGELRYFATRDGKDIELPDGSSIEVAGKMVRPVSRTFIPAMPGDNAFTSAEYMARLDALPEPLRSKLLFGDMRAGRQDDAYQVIPTDWVRRAQARWREREKPTTPMTALGADVARGGKDESTLAPRYGNYFAELVIRPGAETPTSDTYASLVLSVIDPTTVVNIDVIGVGSGPYDALRGHIGDRAIPMNAAEGSEAMDAAGVLGFVNQRAEWHWRLREALDPKSGQDIALPPDPRLTADLCAPRWKLTPRGIQIESKDEIKKRIGRSPDRGDAVVMGNAIKEMPGQGVMDFYKQQLAAKNATKTQPANVVRTTHDLRHKP